MKRSFSEMSETSQFSKRKFLIERPIHIQHLLAVSKRILKRWKKKENDDESASASENASVTTNVTFEDVLEFYSE
jgi:hypothetical protein